MENDVAAKTAAEAAKYWMAESYLALRGYSGGIEKWKEIMSKGLSLAYEKMGAMRLSGPESFLEYVIGRDKMLGLHAGGDIIDENKFSYWIADPFLGLKDKITKKEYEQISTHGYLKTKMDYFLGKDWKAMMHKCPWDSNDDKDNNKTSWLIEKPTQWLEEKLKNPR